MYKYHQSKTSIPALIKNLCIEKVKLINTLNCKIYKSIAPLKVRKNSFLQFHKNILRTVKF